MPLPTIVAVGVATPDLYFTQAETHDFYVEHNMLPAGQAGLYSRLLLDGPIEGRCFALDEAEDIIDEDADDQNSRFTVQGRALAAAACRTALTRARCQAADIGGLVVNTCTGYLCPGLTSYLVEDLDLPNSVKVIDVMGMGCGGAVPNLEVGCGLLSRTSGRPVLCVAVEICTATHMIDDDPGLTVSNCIFADGAAAVLLAETETGPGVQLLDFATGIFPRHREALRYRQQGGKLRNMLSARVPVIGADCLTRVTQRLLKEQGLDVGDVAWWAVHAGGTSVLDEVGRRLGLEGDELGTSRRIFETYGNMSSPTVLFVLDELLQSGRARGAGLLLGFGAGFSAFAALASGKTE